MNLSPSILLHIEILGVVAVVGMVFLWLPNLTRHDIFFAVTVSPEFSHSEEGARIRQSYRAWIGIQIAIALGLVIAGWRMGLPWLTICAPYWLVITALPGFLRARKRVLPHAVVPSTEREAGLNVRNAGALGHPILQAGPFAILLAAGIYLRMRWDEIPSRFAVHYDINNQPNRWAQKGFASVYGALLVGVVMCVLMLVMSALIVHATRQIRTSGAAGEAESRYRQVQLGIVLGSEYFLAVVISWVSLLPLQPVGAINGAVTGMVILTLAFLVVIVAMLVSTGQGGGRLVAESAQAETGSPIGDRTPDACWKAGILYVNSDDSAILVEKRFGFGYTLNFGNPRSWLVVVALVGIPVVVALAFRLVK